MKGYIEISKFVEIVDNAIRSADFWAWLAMHDVLSDLVRFMMDYITSCTCHWPLLKRLRKQPKTDTNIALIALCKGCPCSGRRAVDFACLEMLKEMEDDFVFVSGTIDGALPDDITPASRATLVHEFYCGLGSLKFSITLKFTNWRDPPWIAYKVAARSFARAREAMKEVLATKKNKNTKNKHKQTK